MRQCVVLSLVSLFGFVTACSADDGDSHFPMATGGNGNTGANIAVGGGTSGGTSGSGGVSVGGSGGGVVITGGAGSGGGSSGPWDGKVTAIVRDFSALFPDMEPCYKPVPKECFSGDDLDIVGANQEGIALLTADQNRVPQYAAGPQGTRTTFGSDCGGGSCFPFWYVDDPNYNQRFEFPIQFVQDPADPTKWVYDNPQFFPVDNLGFGHQDGKFPNHNYSFTVEIRLGFKYNATAANQILRFIGDDDVFVYINDRLALNMGGIHNAAMKEIDLAAMADLLGLVHGQDYRLDFFGAERHVSASSFRIETSIAQIVEKLE